MGATSQGVAWVLGFESCVSVAGVVAQVLDRWLVVDPSFEFVGVVGFGGLLDGVV